MAHATHSSDPTTLEPALGASGGRSRVAGGWSRRKQYVLIGLLIAVMSGMSPYAWRLWLYYQTHESTDNAYVVGDVTPISARVSGVIQAVAVETHQAVEAGQLLARLDPRDFSTRVRQAEAAVAVAAAHLRQAEVEVMREQEGTRSDTDRTRAGLHAMQSALQEAQHEVSAVQAQLRTLDAAAAVAQADIDARRAHLDMARMGFERMQQLLTDGVAAQQQVDAADSALRSAQAEHRAARQKRAQAQREVERAQVGLRTQRQAVERARARVAEAQARLAGSQANRQNVGIKQAQVKVARARFQQAQADLAYAELQQSYTTLRAPVAGRTAKNNLEVGQVVQAGRPLLAIVAVQRVWVEANYKETQLRSMRPGQPATLHVDAYPDQTFTGIVESISPGVGSVFSLLPPENATGNFVKVVQRIPVKIILDDAAQGAPVLRPGMSVLATVTTHQAEAD